MGVKEGQYGKIGVLMGGPSSEREISLKSGKAVLQALLSAGVDAVAVDIETDDPAENKGMLKGKGIDCAFIALHGRFGEDGSIQRILEDAGIPYTGPGVVASGRAMNKVSSHRIFQAAGLRVPAYAVMEKAVTGKAGGQRGVPAGFSLPVVVKPASNGSSIGLSLVEEAAAFPRALDLAFEYDDTALVEEYLVGRELTVGVLAGEALPVIEIVHRRKLFDYEAKYQKGMTEYVVPAPLDGRVSAAVMDTAVKAYRALGCTGCSRVDIMLTRDNTPYILEVNTIPGFTETSLLPKAARQAGMDFTALCLKLVSLAYEEEKR